ncbi:hypothetical protein APUTEX25_002400 [Auxenochlorella protothecoides]|uniref:Uncharacterized protein n=1 Tax=Auxenochlorella protothecoides TaxID=3075 RepID=A0A3M7L2G2_AUXPR|nr:hypothetical protein APUTEX25_002400 [Auxenochlorella protothecoides]|eukprot:RMZ56210.1 hypothetical protein APUTEX25_002400 [Auxenochlorella protothecoides]
MGNAISWIQGSDLPPSVVLVPPLLERERKGRSRFTKSSYDRQFARPQLELLFGDYLGPDLRSILHFAPPDDPRINVTAKLGLPRGIGLGTGQSGTEAAGPAVGSMTLRFEPDPRHPYSFVDVKAGAAGAAGNLATMRACMIDAGSGLAAFAQLPLAPGSKQGALLQGQNLRLGARYTSPALSAGAVMSPSQALLHDAWVVGRVGGLVWGASTRPSLALGPLFSEPAPDTDPRSPIQRAVDACLSRASYGIAYSPGAQSATEHGRFTAALELVEERQLSVAFLYHMALQRNVHNPFEGSGEMRRGDVVGITNYVDIGFQMVSDMQSAQGSVLRFGASWQANKNVMLKARAGLDGVSAAAVFRSWWQPAFTAGLAASYDLRTGQPRFGATAAIESYRHLRQVIGWWQVYERSHEGNKMAGARLTQRHVASKEDAAYHEGKGLLVPLSEVDNPLILGQVAPAEADLL